MDEKFIEETKFIVWIQNNKIANNETYVQLVEKHFQCPPGLFKEKLSITLGTMHGNLTKTYSESPEVKKEYQTWRAMKKMLEGAKK